jgi:hypothetical protein
MKSIQLSPTCIITVPDATDQKITVNGRTWRFHFDSQFGPFWICKNGEPRKCQSPTNRDVWAAFQVWLDEWKATA